MINYLVVIFGNLEEKPSEKTAIEEGHQRNIKTKEEYNTKAN